MRKPPVIARAAMLGFALCGALPSTAEPGDVFFVDLTNASGTQNGRSWDTAFDTIQEGIELARDNFGGEVWVAAGTYSEVRVSANGSVIMRPGVDLYGGFDGTESARSQRNPIANPTIIDGSGSRGGNPASPVVDAADDTVLDGFTIQGGRGLAGPGLICVAEENPVIRNCIFRENESLEFGGAVMNIGGSAPRFIGCVFTLNSAGTSGGAVGNTASAPSFIDCTFTRNHADAAGGAIFNTPDSPIIVQGCRFEMNTAVVGGGAIFNEGAEPSIEDSVFIANSTTGFGGAVFNNQAADVLIPADSLVVNSIFARNTAEEGGGAFANQGSFLTAINCTIVGNTAPRDFGGAFFNNAGEIEVSNSIIWYNSAEWIVNLSGSFAEIRWSNVGGGDRGPDNIAAEPRFQDRNNDDYRLLPDSPSIDAGTANGAPDADITGIARPQFDGIDQGAHEATERDEPADGNGGMDCHHNEESDDNNPLSADTVLMGAMLTALFLSRRWRS